MKQLIKLKRKEGFTLVECLIAIAVFAIMSLLVMTIISAALNEHSRNRDTQRSLIIQREGLASNNTTSTSGTIKMTFTDEDGHTYTAEFAVDRVITDGSYTDEVKRGLELTAIKDARAVDTAVRMLGSKGFRGISVSPGTATALGSEADFNTQKSADMASGTWGSYSYAMNIKIASGTAVSKELFIMLPPGTTGVSQTDGPITTMGRNCAIRLSSNGTLAGTNYTVVLYSSEPNTFDAVGDWFGVTSAQTYEEDPDNLGMYFPPSYFAVPNRPKLR